MIWGAPILGTLHIMYVGKWLNLKPGFVAVSFGDTHGNQVSRHQLDGGRSLMATVKKFFRKGRETGTVLNVWVYIYRLDVWQLYIYTVYFNFKYTVDVSLYDIICTYIYISK